MRHCILCSLLTVVFSCAPKQSGHDVFRDVETISLEEALKDNLSFLDRIEIIPLENRDSALVTDFIGFQYLREQKMYMVMDSRQHIFLFDEDGGYISNSGARRGEGPHDYVMAVDAAYNPDDNVVEIYNSMLGIIHRYDLSFRWVGNRKLPGDDKFMAMKMDVLGEELYAFEPVPEKEEGFAVRLYDFSASPPTSEDVPTVAEGYVSTLTMMQKAFSKGDSHWYYAPYYMDYHFYEYDPQQKSFKPIYELDLGRNVTKEELDAKLGSSKGEPADFLWEKCEYLLASTYLLPIIRLIDDSFVYACCVQSRKTHHLIYDRKTKKTYFLTPDAPVKLHRCYALQGNVLATILFPYELEPYVNEESRRYMSEATLRRLEGVKEEDNPLIIKYYLKE